jgi:hypothetical protein
MFVEEVRMPLRDCRISSILDALMLRKDANPSTFSWKWISERAGFLSYDCPRERSAVIRRRNSLRLASRSASLGKSLDCVIREGRLLEPFIPIK